MLGELPFSNVPENQAITIVVARVDDTEDGDSEAN